MTYVSSYINFFIKKRKKQKTKRIKKLKVFGAEGAGFLRENKQFGAEGPEIFCKMQSQPTRVASSSVQRRAVAWGHLVTRAHRCEPLANGSGPLNL